MIFGSLRKRQRRWLSAYDKEAPFRARLIDAVKALLRSHGVEPDHDEVVGELDKLLEDNNIVEPLDLNKPNKTDN